MEPQRTTKKSSSAGKLAAAGAVVILAAAGSFVGGVQYQKGKAPSSATAMTRQAGQFGGPGGGMARNGGIGTVTAISADSISISDQRSSATKTYAITSTTKITNNDATATYSDIAVGDRVLVQTSSTTSTDATSIAVNPTMMGGPGGTTDTQSSGSTTQTN